MVERRRDKGWIDNFTAWRRDENLAFFEDGDVFLTHEFSPESSCDALFGLIESSAISRSSSS